MMVKTRLLGLSLLAVLGVANLVTGTAWGSREYRAQPARLLEPLSVPGGVVVAYGDPAATRIAVYDADGRLRWQRQSPGAPFAREFKACAGLVYAPAFMDGVYVFDVRDGKLRAHLVAGEPHWEALVACRPGLVFITAYRGPTSLVAAFETTTFRRMWMREFVGLNIWYLGVAADVVRVVVAEGTLETPWDDRLVLLRAKDGRQLSARALPRLPPDPEHEWDSLPAPVRTQLLRIFGTPYLSWPNSLLRHGGLLALQQGAGYRAMMHVIRADTGRIVWQRKAPGLWGIGLAGQTAVALIATEQWPYAAKRLDGFDVRNGRLVWSVGLRGTP